MAPWFINFSRDLPVGSLTLFLAPGEESEMTVPCPLDGLGISDWTEIGLYRHRFSAAELVEVSRLAAVAKQVVSPADPVPSGTPFVAFEYHVSGEGEDDQPLPSFPLSSSLPAPITAFDAAVRRIAMAMISHPYRVVRADAAWIPGETGTTGRTAIRMRFHGVGTAPMTIPNPAAYAIDADCGLTLVVTDAQRVQHEVHITSAEITPVTDDMKARRKKAKSLTLDPGAVLTFDLTVGRAPYLTNGTNTGAIRYRNLGGEIGDNETTPGMILIPVGELQVR